MHSLESSRKPGLKAVFLDRDGVINYDAGFVHRRLDFFFLPGVIDALRSIPADYRKIIISNQSGIGRGFFALEAVQELNRWMVSYLNSRGVKIDAIFLCPHVPEDRCRCRKPKLGLFHQAQRTLGIEFARSWVIGDKESDILAGKRLESRTILVNKNRVGRSNPPRVPADFKVAGLREAVEVIRSYSRIRQSRTESHITHV
jgi:D-glycero-D-manno-heptose 1,7-bisphosphate phosphatase